MNSFLRFLGLVAATAGLWVVGEREAEACGGCFQPVPPSQTTTDITDERMLLSVSQTQTTLYDQIRYSGAPQSFAWVLPIHGTVSVGLSADVLFDSVDALTATKVNAPPASCPAPPTCGGGCGANSASAFSNGGAADQSGSVTVTKQENVGPYDTVQLHATDSSALSNWLTNNAFVIPPEVTPTLAAYVAEGFDFLAMKLLPSQGVQSMRPVRVSSPGASFSLPLRMAAIGTGATVGITIWVVSDGRYEPQNFPFYRIADSELVWDWATSSSNYTTLRVHHEAALQQKGWEIECSIELNQQTVSSAIASGGQNLSGPSYGALTSDPGADYLPVLSPPDSGATADGAGRTADAAVQDGGLAGDTGAPDAGDPDVSLEGDVVAEGGAVPDSGVGAGPTVVETAEQVRTDDIATLFAGLPGPNVRVTRMRSDIAHSAMTVDFVIRASGDQSELSNVRTPVQSVNETCPIYNGCYVVGQGTPAQSAASLNKSGCAAAPARVANPMGALATTLGLAVPLALRTVRRRRWSRPQR
jgi:hypothetical protein